MIEYRYQRKAAPGVKDDGNLFGRAIVYNSWTTIGDMKRYGFREKVNPTAARKSIKDGDIVLLDNHEARLPLARASAGTLRFKNVSAGLDWDATPVDTTYGNDVRKNVKAHNYGGCSFGFEVIRDHWTDDDGNESDPVNGTNRELLEVKVHEISVCTFPAYGDTIVGARDQITAARGAAFERAAPGFSSGPMDLNGAGGMEQAPDTTDSKMHGDHVFWDGDGDGDCDMTVQCDVDHDHWDINGHQLKPIPGKPLNGKSVEFDMSVSDDGNDVVEDLLGRSARDDKKPYGDVPYADPGYQKDGKKRYPIDTKDRAKAAWSYINQEKNASAYSAQQLASIKSKIKAALKKFGVDTEGEKNWSAWEALCDFREMTEGLVFGEEFDGDEFGVRPDGFVRIEDANDLATRIRDAYTAELRVDCIERAVDFNLAEMIPAHWGPKGEIGSDKSADVVRDMDRIYELALGMNPTREALDILDLAQPYLSNDTRASAAEAQKNGQNEPDESFVAYDDTMTLAEARERLEQLQSRRYETDRLGR